MNVNTDDPKSSEIHPQRSQSVATKIAEKAKKSMARAVASVPSVASTDVTRSAARRFHFTKRAIDSLPLPTEGHDVYNDEELRGLQLRVFPSGAKTFQLSRRIAGRPERIKIGPYPDLTVEQARDEAQRLNGEIAMGANPAEQKRSLSAEMTLKELFDLDLEHHGKKHKRTWKEDVAQFERYLGGLGRCKLSTITRPQLVALHASIGERNGIYSANAIVRLLRAMFNRARVQWGWTGENPATGIKLFKETKRQRFLDADELPRFFRALAEEPNPTLRDYILLLLLTGARRSNLMAMTWPEIRWHRGVWEIPAEKSKSGEPMDVMLTPFALDVLTKRRDEAETDPLWVFPNRRKNGHLMEPRFAWERILQRAGIEDCHLHDLRRTLGSWQTMQGASLSIVGKSLGHQSLQSTAVYARLNSDPVRASVNKANDAMLALMPRGILLPAPAPKGKQ